MTVELQVLVFAALWGVAQILIAAVAPAFKSGYFQWNASPRDEDFDVGPAAGRMRRAYQNYLETFPFFAVIVIALAFAGKSNDLSRLGAHIYLLARVAYFPAYALGTKLRSAFYLLSLVGIGMCVWTCFA
ncbi:MAPEG family protein [Asticcacaulis sp.]|uniref:MAPEG family protein n=1 Tax=Asticcacaulis sp. TaxID=1872648 RepID=UPI002602E150|nr:MAPEG family protein [Asticcacaulis sp.]